MSKYKGMTIEDHKKAAKLLRGINDTYGELLELVSGKYPVALLDKIIRECNVGFAGKIRSELENHFYKENPEWDGTFIYYTVGSNDNTDA